MLGFVYFDLRVYRDSQLFIDYIAVISYHCYRVCVTNTLHNSTLRYVWGLYFARCVLFLSRRTDVKLECRFRGDEALLDIYRSITVSVFRPYSIPVFSVVVVFF